MKKPKIIIASIIIIVVILLGATILKISKKEVLEDIELKGEYIATVSFYRNDLTDAGTTYTYYIYPEGDTTYVYAKTSSIVTIARFK